MIGIPLSEGSAHSGRPTAIGRTPTHLLSGTFSNNARSVALDQLAAAEVDARRADSWANDPRRYDDIDDKEYDA